MVSSNPNIDPFPVRARLGPPPPADPPFPVELPDPKDGRVEVLAGVVGAKEGVGAGVESERTSVVSVISVGVGVVSAMGAESS